MSKVKIEGTVHAVGDTQSFGAKGFRKREVGVEVNAGKFPDYVPIEFSNDLADSSASIQTDAHIVVEGYVTGRKWQRDPSSEVKYFCGIKAVSFSVNGTSSVEEPASVPSYSSDDSMDIPF